MNKKFFGGSAPVGGCTLLVIFSVLCLTVFALLCISTARSEQALSQKAAGASAEYARADNQAHRILARLRAGETPEGVTKDGDRYSYACPVSSTRTLAVCVEVKDGSYQVMLWQTVAADTWQPDEYLDLWEGR